MKHLETCAERFNAFAECDCRDPLSPNTKTNSPTPAEVANAVAYFTTAPSAGDREQAAILAARVAELEGALHDAGAYLEHTSMSLSAEHGIAVREHARAAYAVAKGVKGVK